MGNARNPAKSGQYDRAWRPAGDLVTESQTGADQMSFGEWSLEHREFYQLDGQQRETRCPESKWGSTMPSFCCPG